MKVICKGHNTCDYAKECPHAKLHDVKDDNIDQTENCTLLHEKHLYITLPDSCYCDVKYGRKIKLNNLKNKNDEKFSEKIEE